MTASRPTIGPIPIVSLAVPRSLVAEADELPKETAEIAVLAGILGRRWRLTVRGTLLQGNNGWISRRELMNMKPSLVVFIIRRRDVDASRQETPFFSLSIQTRLSLSRGFFFFNGHSELPRRSLALGQWPSQLAAPRPKPYRP